MVCPADLLRRSLKGEEGRCEDQSDLNEGGVAECHLGEYMDALHGPFCVEKGRIGGQGSAQYDGKDDHQQKDHIVPAL